MATKLTVKGLTEFIHNLEELGKNGKKFAKRSLYEGAGVMADAIKSSVDSIPVRAEATVSRSSGMQSGITATQKQGLIDGFGISGMRDAGPGVNVKLGFGGKNADGRSNASVADAAESGRSWVQPTHFFSRAINGSKGAAESAMEKEFTEQVRQIMS